jgi:hypothetical protein
MRPNLEAVALAGDVVWWLNLQRQSYGQLVHVEHIARGSPESPWELTFRIGRERWRDQLTIDPGLGWRITQSVQNVDGQERKTTIGYAPCGDDWLFVSSTTEGTAPEGHWHATSIREPLDEAGRSALRARLADLPRIRGPKGRPIWVRVVQFVGMAWLALGLLGTVGTWIQLRACPPPKS